MRHTFASAFGFATAIFAVLSILTAGVLSLECLDHEKKIELLEKELASEKARNQPASENPA